MEDIGNLQKIFHVYEERYHKAEKMGIDESSPFYAAMKEIECRYVALYFTVEMINSLKNKCNEQGFKKYCYEFFQMIAKQMVLYEEIINEDGKKEYIAQKIRISRQDAYAMNAYQNAKRSFISFQEMNYEEDDKNKVCMKISENILNMIHWMMMVREMRFPVNRGKIDMICSK